MADKNWPSWRYGPSGEAQVFQREADVPEGWVDSPSKLPPAPEKPGGETAGSSLETLRAYEEERDHLSSEVERLAAESESLREMNESKYVQIVELRNEIAKLREENRRLQEKAAISISGRTTEPASEPEQPSARRPRKLGAKATPFTPDDETVTLDEGRAERLKVLREAGVTIADDATDGDIEEALDWLEQQAKKD